MVDAVAVGAIAFGTAAIIDNIFDDDDDWDDYWGCRNCGGWHGAPIIRDPDIDIDVDGNVNIGNRIDIDRTNIGNRDVNIRDRDGNLNIGDREVGWNPDRTKVESARNKIATNRGEGGKTKLPIKKQEGWSDALRDKLAARSGTTDISRPDNGDRNLANIDRSNLGSIDRSNLQRPNIDRGNLDRPNLDRPSSRPAVDKAAVLQKTKARPAAKPAIARKADAAKRPTAKPAQVKKGEGLAKKGSAHKTKAASHRGKSAKRKR